MSISVEGWVGFYGIFSTVRLHHALEKHKTEKENSSLLILTTSYAVWSRSREPRGKLSVQTVAEDVFIWSVGPKHSVNPSLKFDSEILLLTYYIVATLKARLRRVC